MINRRLFLAGPAILMSAAQKPAAATPSHQPITLSSLLKEINSLRIKEGKFVDAFKKTKNGGIEWAASNQALLSISQIMHDDDADKILISYLTKFLENINNHIFTPDIKFTHNSHQIKKDSKNKIAAAGAFLSLIEKIKAKDSNQKWLKENLSKIINYAYFNSLENQLKSTPENSRNIINPDIHNDLESHIYIYNGLKDIEKKLLINGLNDEAEFIAQKIPYHEEKINQLMINSSLRSPSALYIESLKVESILHYADEVWTYNKNRILNSNEDATFPTKYLALSASISTQRGAHLITEKCLSLLGNQYQKSNHTLPIDIIALLAVSVYYSGGVLR